MVIQKMSELGMSSPGAATEGEEMAESPDLHQPLYANTDEDQSNANTASTATADRENNTIPVRLKKSFSRRQLSTMCS